MMNSQVTLPYLIAEVANSHGGKKEIIEKLISSFGKLDYPKKGIKFQAFSPDMIALADFEWYEIYKELFIPKRTWKSLIKKAIIYGDVWLDIFDIYGIEVFIENFESIYGVKLQASVLENYEVRESLSKLNLNEKKIILNVSGFDLSAIQKIYCFFKGLCPYIIIQIGYQSYPTKIEDTSLSKIPVLKSAFPVTPLCMADHADAETRFALNVPIYAALLGCDFVEKHFCLDRKSAKYDGYSALEYLELSEVCSSLKEAFLACKTNFISEMEEKYLEKSLQAPVLKKDMVAGEFVADSDMIYRRTSQTGIGSLELLKLREHSKVLTHDKSAKCALIADDFRSASVAVIVAGRMKSTRLPQKAILPIAGIPSVERCLSQCKGIKGVERIILATSDLEEDSILANYTLGDSVSFWQGDPDDVISRYLGACEKYEIDVVVRITADCPLVMPDIIDYLMRKHFEAGADYTAAEDCAVGSSGEIINVSALRKIIKHFGEAKYSEYMTWYFRNNPEHFKINIVSMPQIFLRNYRLTLDYPEDLEMFVKLFSKLETDKQHYSANDVFDVLDSSPEIVRINNHLTLKYKTDKKLINLLNTVTRME